jgi:hypothetical protein
VWEFPKRLVGIHYISDLNLPGEDVADNRRDAFYRSLTYAATRNLSLQRTAMLYYEQEWQSRLSLRIGGRYLDDRPLGAIRHPALTTTELQLALRYAPGELFLQNRDRRLYLRPATIEWKMQHRVGLKGVFGAGHRYQITDISVRKRWFFPKNKGEADVRLSAGKVWNRAPFPVLFVPQANPSYVFSDDAYNRMRVYEFVTDRFLAAQVEGMVRYSPLDLFTRSTVCTTFGIKALYGSLSARNRPELHPELFPLPGGVHALGRVPYVEVHAGFARLLNLFRVEWVQRLTYGSYGGILFGFSF